MSAKQRVGAASESLLCVRVRSLGPGWAFRGVGPPAGPLALSPRRRAADTAHCRGSSARPSFA